MQYNGYEIGKRQPTPVPIREREIITKPILTVEQWGPERVKEYLAEKYPRKKPKRKHERVYQWDKRKDEGEMTVIKMTREEYLVERAAGKNRAQIANDLGLKHQAYLYPTLEKWGVKDRDAEQEAIRLLSNPATLDEPSHESLAEVTKAIEETAPSTESVKTGPFVIGAVKDNGVIISNASITPLTPAPEIHSEPSSEAAEPSDEPEPLPVPSEPQTPPETVQYVTVRIPMNSVWTSPDDFVDTLNSRDDFVSLSMKLLANVVASVRNDLTDILGAGDYTAQVQQFLERKVAQL